MHMLELVIIHFMAKRSLAKVVHACELNPNSIKGLKWAREANNLEESIVIHEGDNNETLPKLYGIADRCHLGLLHPLSRYGNTQFNA